MRLSFSQITFAFPYLLSSAGCLVVLCLRRWRSGTWRFVLLFLVLGCLTSFLDRLSTPLIVFLFPLLVHRLTADVDRPSDENNLRPKVGPLFDLVRFGAAWVYGLVGFWLLKLVLSIFYVGPEAWFFFLDAFLKRSSSMARGQELGLGDATVKNFSVFAAGREKLLPDSLLLFCLCMAVFLLAVLYRSFRIKLKRTFVLHYSIFLAAFGLPVLWFELLPNLTFIHGNFTCFNLLPASVFLFFLTLEGLEVLVKETPRVWTKDTS
jgi:hypothetical protein